VKLELSAAGLGDLESKMFEGSLRQLLVIYNDERDPAGRSVIHRRWNTATCPPPVLAPEYRRAPTESAPAPAESNDPSTTGLPHRPSSSDGQTSVFVSSNPIGLCYRLPKFARRYACLSLAIGGFGSALVPIVSHRRRTVRHGFYRILNNTGLRYRPSIRQFNPAMA
jgi:hypothetical protein